MAHRALVFALLIAGVASCARDDDCSLLGKCVGGSCACFAGWTGTACSRADLAPLDPSLGYQNASAASWGGRALRDPATGRHHLMATEITNGCPLIFFEYNSQVVHAVSDAGAGGPYEKVGGVLPPFHHNPTFVGPTPDGYWLLFFIGADNITGQVDCADGPPSGVPLPSWHNSSRQDVDSNQYISMAWTKDLDAGEWQTRVVLRDNGPQFNQSSWHCIENNPSVVVSPNGTVTMVYRANGCNKDAPTAGEHLGIAVAPHWSGEFIRDSNYIIAPQTSTTGKVNNEDPFLFTVPADPTADADAAGAAPPTWHIVNHQQSPGNVCGSPDAGHSCGAHWFAHNPHGPWTLSPEPVYNENVTLTNGSTARFLTRQRPQLVFAADGFTPAFLFTSGSFDGNNPDFSCFSHTYAHAFNSAGTTRSAKE